MDLNGRPIPPGATWVRFPRYIGDAVMLATVLRALRGLGVGPLVAWGPRLALSVLQGQDLADAILPDVGKPGPRALAGLLRAHRAARSVHFPKSLRPALGAWLARVPERIGVSESLAGPFNTHTLPFWKGEGTCLERYRKVLALRWPELTSLPWADLRPVAPVERPDRAYVCLMPGASNAARAWPAEHFRALARLAAEAGYVVVVQGGPGEKELGAFVAGEAGVNACGASLPEATSLFAGAAGAVGNDSGLGHLAAACGIPTVTLSGPMDTVMFRPWGPRVEVLSRDVPCKPCKHKVCPVPGHPCLGTPPERAWESLVALMAQAQ